METKKPPVAVAGADQRIQLPVDSAVLDGSASYDLDGTITGFAWSAISGTISSPVAGAAKASVRNLSAGIYLFELTVTDNDGLLAKDTVSVTIDSADNVNRPPVADAGADQTINLPENKVMLIGSNSYDPDNDITTYAWQKIAGPGNITITAPSSIETQATSLQAGEYQFSLTVTDAGGLFDSDTIIVKVINEPLSTSCIIKGAVEVASFSSPKPVLISASGNGKFYYTDGVTMDIFDPVANTIVKSERLSASHRGPSAFFAGDKVFFAGGSESSRVDIYNTINGSWSTAELSIPRIINLGTATMGNKVFFAGGITGPDKMSSRVDIYDLSTNTWTQRELSQAGCFTTARVQNKIWFVTTNSRQVDVYDGDTDSWNTITLSSPVYRQEPSAIAMGNALQIGNKIYFTGEQNVSVYDINSQSWSSISLSESKFNIPALVSNGKIAFIGGMTSWFVYSSNIEIYDPATNSWSIQPMEKDLYYQALNTYDNFIFSAGGMTDQENMPLAGICRFGL